MQAARHLYNFTDKSKVRLMFAAMVAMGIPLVTLLVMLVADDTIFRSYPFLFLVPWLIALAIVLAIPSAILYYQGRFSLADPIVFATWSFFLPICVVGGFFLAIGMSDPYFLNFVQDMHFNLPYTVVLIMLGFASMCLGYFFPLANRLGQWISGLLPRTDYPASSYLLPGLALLALGFLNSIIAFSLGVLGYQKAQEINTYDGLIYLTTHFWLEASFLLCLVIFIRRRYDTLTVLAIGALVATSVSRALFAGSRGSLLQVCIMIVLAYVLAGRSFRLKQSVIAGSAFLVIVTIGMVYGTTFRTVKGHETRQDIGQYSGNIVSTLDQLGRDSPSNQLSLAFYNLAPRLDGISSVAVVVSNYEQLAPYEESYGIDNNIWKDSLTFLIPRFIWPDKPVASEARRYSDLYFNFAESSFAITPIGDLLRNFGIVGVPIGMFALGFVWRTIYRALVSDQPRVPWRLTLYLMLITAISYESFYGSIAPYLFRTGTIAVIGIILVNIFAARLSSKPAN